MSGASTKGRLVGVCLSHHRQAPKKNIQKGILRNGWGLEGDSHAGSERHISLLASEEVERVCKARRIKAPPGSFAENLATQGIDLGRVSVGQHISVGETTLEVVAVGKDPAEPHTYSYCGHSLLPDKGVFARVIRGGPVKVGDTVALDPPSRSRKPVRGRRGLRHRDG